MSCTLSLPHATAGCLKAGLLRRARVFRSFKLATNFVILIGPPNGAADSPANSPADSLADKHAGWRDLAAPTCML